MRRVAVAVVVIGSVVAASGQASADKGGHQPPQPDDLYLQVAADDGCAFAVTIEAVKGKTGPILFDDGRAISPAPGLKLQLTNTAIPSKTILLQATGSFHDQPAATDDDVIYTWDTLAVGQNVLLGILTDGPVDRPILLYTVGRVTVTITVDTDAGIVYFSHLDTSAAKVVDVCPKLA